MAAGGFTASDVLKYDGTLAIWYYDGLTDGGGQSSYRDEAEYTFYIRVT